MSLVTPFWFKQRQAKAEPTGDQEYRLSGPNLQEAYLSVRRADGGYVGVLRLTADGPEVAATESCDNLYDAWEAAFELYRQWFVV